MTLNNFSVLAQDYICGSSSPTLDAWHDRLKYKILLSLKFPTVLPANIYCDIDDYSYVTDADFKLISSFWT
jgi:hypothetical protein